MITRFRNISGSLLLVSNNVQILDSGKCNTISQWFKESEICGTWSINQTVCSGDSGNWLITLRENGVKILIGFNSYLHPLSDRCTSEQIYVVLTRVSYFLDWIASNIEGKSTDSLD